jgi:hypothetical protein
MPRYNIWIRKQDLPKWDSIENKSEWVHEKLREESFEELEVTAEVESQELKIVELPKS